MRRTTITPQHVDFMPKSLDSGILYISLKYRTAAHKCCCGCGTKIVTPLTPTDWQLTELDGRVSLWPSVGNWNHPCQSHYIIHKSQVLWADAMSLQQIARGREHDRAAKSAYYGRHGRVASDGAASSDKNRGLRFWWKRLLEWIRS